ncbi:hypothetical protein DdX_06906 [Ditylenchus destructor]|uniref:Uncharacterized protein n=1 Tax=Ditylenchus destructor TaxID=166010 RepID=A0AAD4N8D6_9BILA|nr:hypothetical protein DdX_06906 [Ditylenchus destructor]
MHFPFLSHSATPGPCRQQHNLTAFDAEAHFKKMLLAGKPQAASTSAVSNNDLKLAEDDAAPIPPSKLKLSVRPASEHGFEFPPFGILYFCP